MTGLGVRDLARMTALARLLPDGPERMLVAAFAAAWFEHDPFAGFDAVVDHCCAHGIDRGALLDDLAAAGWPRLLDLGAS